jgi:hypothetical protein
MPAISAMDHSSVTYYDCPSKSSLEWTNVISRDKLHLAISTTIAGSTTLLACMHQPQLNKTTNSESL